MKKLERIDRLSYLHSMYTEHVRKNVDILRGFMDNAKVDGWEGTWNELTMCGGLQTIPLDVDGAPCCVGRY